MMTRTPPRVTGRSPKGHPVIGNLIAFRRDQLGLVEDCAASYGDFVPVSVVGHKAYLVNHPDLIEEVLVTRNRDFRKVFMLRNTRLCLGEGLLTSEGEHWRNQRRLVQPAFHSSRVARYGQVMRDEAHRLAASWAAGGDVDVHEEMMQLTLRIVLCCLFDTGVPDDLRTVTTHVELIQKRIRKRVTALLPLPDTAPTLGNIPLRRSVRALDRLIYSLIEQRRSGGFGDDLLSLLIQAHDQDTGAMTDRQLRDEVMTLFLAGHETTALALTWSLYLLGTHPDLADELTGALDGLLGDRDPDVTDLDRLLPVEQVLKEALRLFPPVYIFGRDAVRDTKVAGHPVRAGHSIILTPWVLHRDQRFYPTPEIFDPSRWTAEFEKTLPRHAYCPFGGGPRLCVGKSFAMTEMKIVLAILAHRFRLTLTNPTPVPLVPCFTLRPEGGVPMTVTARRTDQIKERPWH